MDETLRQELVSVLVDAHAEIQIHDAHHMHDIRGKGRSCYQCELAWRLNSSVEKLRKIPNAG